ncbi:MAG: WYL domain-containing protein [Actinomycetota bacterium]
MRADRLISALLILQSKGKTTAAELAEELEVSERTARRDLEALAMSGVPIYSTSGRGGGWQLVGGARTDLTGLSAGESRALFLALGEIGRRDPVLDGALQKLLVALPDRFRDDAAAATTAIKVDTAGWGQIGRGNKPAFVDELSEAVVAGVQVRLEYQRPNDASASERVVHPLGLVTKRGVWYLVAGTERGVRTYRLSRVHGVVLLGDSVVRPDGFDLDVEWERIVTAVETFRSGAEVRVWVDPAMVTPVRWIFGPRRTEHSIDADGRVEMTLIENGAQALASQLAGLTTGLEFVDVPDDVAAELQRIARALAGRWLDGPASQG